MGSGKIEPYNCFSDCLSRSGADDRQLVGCPQQSTASFGVAWSIQKLVSFFSGNLDMHHSYLLCLPGLLNIPESFSALALTTKMLLPLLPFMSKYAPLFALMLFLASMLAFVYAACALSFVPPML